MRKNTILFSDLKFFEEQPVTVLAANIFRICIFFFTFIVSYCKNEIQMPVECKFIRNVYKSMHIQRNLRKEWTVLLINFLNNRLTYSCRSKSCVKFRRTWLVNWCCSLLATKEDSASFSETLVFIHLLTRIYISSGLISIILEARISNLA